MFFKRLEIVGFKSFATKTIVEFLPGVTVIVGPNGCGKSNVLDSIKWVLGSQSPKSLRGKTMQDIIFAGSASFKPLGVAQVTLTIDNSRRMLDTDYDEIQISRRLFRTGESEYFLNKVPCRLRDIHNLLLGTGAGMMSYSVLEQGKVDQIINAKPEERRYIFEEAAGISKFKVRKLEALRKLERTATDLKRLEDLVGEITRQVASLKRQAAKAERYKEASAELRKADMELMTLRSSGLRDQLVEVQEKIASLQDQIAELQARGAQKSAEDQTLRNRADELELKLAEQSREHASLTGRIKDLEHQSGRCTDRIEANRRRLQQLETEFEQFTAREAELASRRDDIAQRLDQASAERETADGARLEIEAEHGRMRIQSEERTRALEEANREVALHRDKLSKCENQIRIEETLLLRHEETRRESEGILEKLRLTLVEHEGRKGEIEGKLEETRGQIEQAQTHSSSLQIRFAETHARIADLSRERDAANRELHQGQARLSILRELKSNFEGFYQGVREIMKANAKGELAGVVGPIVNLVKSKREYELAAEVALGPHLQDVVVASADAARICMDFLNRGQFGRVTFLALDRLGNGDHEQIDAVLAQEGVVGYAPRLVEHAAEHEAVVKMLLGRTVVVKDKDIAERLHKDFPHFTYVALDGQMIHFSGAMTGGNLKSSGLLGREREIHELSEAVAGLTARLEENQTKIQTERAAADQLSGDMKACTGELHEFEVRRAGLMKELESVVRHHDESKRQLGQREEQLRTLSGEIESKTARKAELEAERIGLDEIVAKSAGSLDQLKEDARQGVEALHALGQRLSEARVAVEKIRERLVHLEENRAAIAREESALALDRESRGNERAHLLQDCDLAQAEIEVVRSELKGLFESRETLDHALTECRSEKEQMGITLRQLAHELEQTQRDERIVENEMHERQIRQAELQGGINNLTDQAREKFNKELMEIVAEVGPLEKDAAALTQEVAQLREKLDRMGAVNLAALDEYEEQNTRLQFLSAQQTDLVQSKEQIEASIAQLDEMTKQLFHETFESVRGHFIEMFRRLFNGGKADLVIDQQTGDPWLEGGIEIYAQPPGKKLQTLSLMSGGEKAMTAISLLFGLFLHKPAPFAILDEIDAPLDDANVERFKNVLVEFAGGTQFVIITHNKQTMELADAIYGVTMEESGVSKLVSVKFEQANVEAIPSAG